MIALIYIY